MLIDYTSYVKSSVNRCSSVIVERRPASALPRETSRAMASLDDFFAKRDKKKGNVKKFTTTDEIAKKIEENSKKVADKAEKAETKERKDRAVSRNVEDGAASESGSGVS